MGIAGYERILGPDKVFTLQTKLVFADFLALSGDQPAARDLYTEVVTTSERVRAHLDSLDD
ncbi:hypothetical protein [Nonomuraea endophytica]|uniref:Uncharacterized protein n=1 Tax=Nonomuraea endophytica TaxID=714136 RepID=A0A7W8AG08_9ACTN|nr:hypothetical protein [Nonomuraea endophytica]MBB5084078.1 hypothetical protein [Nonomuraea endophytica]